MTKRPTYDVQIKQGNELKAQPKLYCIFDVSSQEFMKKFHSKKIQKIKWLRFGKVVGADWHIVKGMTPRQAWKHHWISDVYVLKTKQEAEDVIEKTRRLYKECDIGCGVLHAVEIKKISWGKYKMTDPVMIYDPILR